MSNGMRSNGEEQPPAGVLKRTLAVITADLRPVRRLPSDAVLITLALAVFLALSLISGAVLGLQGFMGLTSVQRWTYYGTLIGCGLVLAVGLAPQVVPGAKRRLGLLTTLGAPLLAVGLCTLFIFPEANLNHFVALGVPCLSAGLVCAAAGSAIASLLLGRGYLVTPVQTWVITAFFAGFTGVGMLSVHCRQQNWMHVFVWHLGVPILSIAAVLLLASLRRRPE